jgi:predicted phosphodiesterase
MRVSHIIFLSIVLLISLSFKKRAETHPNESKNKTNRPTFIHWGTKHNTLRGVTITWLSSDSDDSIKWGYSKSFESGRYSAKPRGDYKKYLYDYTFPSLKPISQVHFAIKSGKEWGENRHFTTTVDTTSETFSFIAGSDCHGGDDDHDSDSRWKLMSELILKEDSDFYLFTGDVVDDEDDWDLWEPFYTNGKNLFEKKIIFYSWGNHEYGPIALHNSTLPGNEKWYSFSQGNALFISLLTEEDLDIQYQWLLDQLRTTVKEWIIVYFHRPFFTRGSHKDEMNELRSTWWKAFDDYGVDIVMSGHTHSYIRSKPLNLNISDTSAVKEYGSNPGQGRMSFVLAGLGGKNSRASKDWFAANAYSGLHYVKFNISSNQLHFDTYSHDGVLIDSLSLHSGNSD